MEDFQSKKAVLYTAAAFAISEAICYSLKRWDRLLRYCENEMQNIDNNAEALFVSCCFCPASIFGWLYKTSVYCP